jgi:hypothetical protein
MNQSNRRAAVLVDVLISVAWIRYLGLVAAGTRRLRLPADLENLSEK